MEPRTSFQQSSRAGSLLVTGILPLALLSWFGCGPAQDTSAGIVQSEQAALVAAGGDGPVAGIDIAVPPGRRDMQPAIALSYSSRMGPGIAGVG